jgi:predicted nucleic acid-binding protein
MIVVADTSPLNYLILIEAEDLLPKLFGRVVIPNAVFEEMQDVGASASVRKWVQNLPKWIEIRQTVLTADASLDILDAGEREAIMLAQELAADLLLVDDKQARLAAVDLGIAITGTIGILDKAAREGLIDLKSAIEKIQKTSFRISDNLIEKLIEESEERTSLEQGSEGRT